MSPQDPVSDHQDVWPPPQHFKAPALDSFTRQFGSTFPVPVFLQHDLGQMALYDLPPVSRPSDLAIVIVHGLNTPAIGMVPLAKELQRLNPEAHIVLFDLWGHGLSDTPAVPHRAEIFHSQIQHVLEHMHWSSAHLIGFSFGGSTVVSFTGRYPESVRSATLLAPAGLFSIDHGLQTLLQDSTRKTEAKRALLEWLEGGPLIVPDDWQARMMSGEVVAEALRQWELKEHEGYTYSVLSMFRDGGTLGQKENFAELAKGNVKHLVVIAEEDDVCSREDLESVGFKHVEVVLGAGHAFVRSRYPEVATILHSFLSSLR